MKLTKNMRNIIIAVGIVILVIFGKPAFGVLFFLIFAGLFLTPIIIFSNVIKSNNKLNLAINNFEESKDVSYVKEITSYLSENKFKGATNHHFFKKMRDFYASVEASEHGTIEILRDLEQAMLVYNVKLENKDSISLDDTITE